MVKRYEMSDAQWRRIEGLLPGKPGDPGRTAEDNRLFVNGVLWVLRSGAHWHDLPVRQGVRPGAALLQSKANASEFIRFLATRRLGSVV
jgi:transposase